MCGPERTCSDLVFSTEQHRGPKSGVATHDFEQSLHKLRPPDTSVKCMRSQILRQEIDFATSQMIDVGRQENGKRTAHAHIQPRADMHCCVKVACIPDISAMEIFLPLLYSRMTLICEDQSEMSMGLQHHILKI